MIIDFKDLLLQRYLDRGLEIPLVADVFEHSTAMINDAVEAMVIASAAVEAAVNAGLDPEMFRPVNLHEYRHGVSIFFDSKGSVGAEEDCILSPAADSPVSRTADVCGNSNEHTDGAGNSEGDHYTYRLVGLISTTETEGSFTEGLVHLRKSPPHPVVDVMRIAPGADHWDIVLDGAWTPYGPPVGYLEWLNSTTS